MYNFTVVAYSRNLKLTIGSILLSLSNGRASLGLREVTGSMPVFSTTCILMVGKAMEGTIPGHHAYAGELTDTLSQPSLPS